MALKVPYPSKLYQPLNLCAYCASTDGLSTEHIIPYGLGSDLVLPKSSCESCRKATSKVEDFVLRRYLCPLRSYLSLPSRKPLQRPDGYKLTLKRNGRSWAQKVKLSDHPGNIRFIMFDPPGRVAGRPAEQSTFSIRLIEANIFSDWQQRLARLGADTAEDKVAMNAMALARMIAKSAHAFAIAELGHEAFEGTYVNQLVKEGAADWNYWVGGYNRGKEITASALHELKFLRRGQELSVIVHLFVPYCPSDAYEVVVGRLRPGTEIPSELLLE
jgi:hypothetical protein